PAASLVHSLLSACPRVKIMATSREPLRVSGESEFPAVGLRLPTPDELGSLEAVQRSDSVSLSLDRARASQPGFRLTAQNASSIATICRLLDGLPLAIELAAARVRLLPPDA